MIIARVGNNVYRVDEAWEEPERFHNIELELRREVNNSSIELYPLCCCGSLAHIKLSKHGTSSELKTFPLTAISPPLHHSHPLTPFCLTFPSHPLFPRQTWPEPLHVPPLTLDRIIAHKSGSFMYFNSMHRYQDFALFPQGFIWLQCFYLKLTDRAVAFNIPHSLWTQGSTHCWGPNSGLQKAFKRQEAGPWSFLDWSQWSLQMEMNPWYISRGF